ncbi:MAG: DUF192 domain-containing protein [Planctomycetes bacterium]|nr:DUF192 domain-containing protein [Planctomycetota bacterium]
MSGDQKTGWLRHLITFIFIFAVGGFMIHRGGCLKSQPPLRPENARIVDLKIQDWQIQAEIADTPELRQKGLQGRQHLPQGSGMLFILDEPRVPQFWMKDTTIELSIAFIKEDGTIVSIKQMEPRSPVHISPEEPVKYALEVRQGWFADRHIGAGAKVEIPEDIPSAPPPTSAETEGEMETPTTETPPAVPAP